MSPTRNLQQTLLAKASPVDFREAHQSLAEAGYHRVVQDSAAAGKEEFSDESLYCLSSRCAACGAWGMDYILYQRIRQPLRATERAMFMQCPCCGAWDEMTDEDVPRYRQG